MATQTPNLKLIKPISDDIFNVNDVSTNLDRIDKWGDSALSVESLDAKLDVLPQLGSWKRRTTTKAAPDPEAWVPAATAPFTQVLDFYYNVINGILYGHMSISWGAIGNTGIFVYLPTDLAFDITYVPICIGSFSISLPALSSSRIVGSIYATSNASSSIMHFLPAIGFGTLGIVTLNNIGSPAMRYSSSTTNNVPWASKQDNGYITATFSYKLA